MISLLEAVKPYISSFKGIRLSTRPDYIDDEILTILISGLQITESCVKDVSRLIKQYGFSLGLQMMTGLYKADFESDMYTADEFVKLSPDCVRIYPTVIMKDTDLADLYLNKEYTPYTLDESV